MSWKDWLAGAAFVVLLAFAVTTFVVVVHHERTHRPHISQRQENNLVSLGCYQNTGNGGC